MSRRRAYPQEQSFYGDTLLLLLLTAAALLFFLQPVIGTHLHIGFPLDDGWIHAVYARSFAHDGTFSFNPGEPSTGSSSLLWTVFLAAGRLAGGGPVAVAWMLGAVCALLLSLAFHRLLLRGDYGRISSAAGAAILPLSGLLLWWTLSGMEILLFLLFATAAMLFFVQGRLKLSGVALALLVLTRPEGLLLAIVLAFAAWRHARSWRPALILLSISSIGVLIYAGFNLAMNGTVLTSTFAGRRWLATGGRPISDNPLRIFPAIADMLYRWTRTLVWGVMRGAGPGLWGLAGAAGLAGIWGIARRIRGFVGRIHESAPRRASMGMVLIVWIAGHVLAYAIMLPYPGHAGRYLAPMLLGVGWFVAWVLQGLTRQEVTLSALRLLGGYVLPRAVLLAAMVVLGARALTEWRVVWQSSVEHINSVHVRAARWVHDETPPDARIAAYDIGALGYFGKRYVIDLGGLIEPAALPYMRGNIDAFIDSTKADYIAMVAPHQGMFTPGYIPAMLGYGNSGTVQATLEAHFSYPEQRYQRHVTVTGNAYPRIIIEKVAQIPAKP
ncbi:hypothetical protein KQI65_12235 [bacterium]|nr:hypothetical protein [bacterium]